MSTRKRTFSQLTNPSNEEQPFKKIKRSKDDCINTMFTNSIDHKECIEYMENIEKSDFVRSLFVPLDICRNIAEYATGKVEKCGNEMCEADICVLNEALVAFENGVEAEWAYCDEQKIYFCALCKPSTVKFICCGTTQYVKEKKKCSGHWICKGQAEVPYCDDDCFFEYERLMAYKCDFCDDLDNDDGRTCEKCGDWTCAFHRDMRLCDRGKHNHCCDFSSWCETCSDRFCYGCDEMGFLCSKCWCSYCENCWEQQDENFSCEACGTDLCSFCYAGARKGLNQITECECWGTFDKMNEFKPHNK